MPASACLLSTGPATSGDTRDAKVAHTLESSVVSQTAIDPLLPAAASVNGRSFRKPKQNSFPTCSTTEGYSVTMDAPPRKSTHTETRSNARRRTAGNIP